MSQACSSSISYELYLEGDGKISNRVKYKDWIELVSELKTDVRFHSVQNEEFDAIDLILTAYFDDEIEVNHHFTVYIYPDCSDIETDHTQISNRDIDEVYDFIDYDRNARSQINNSKER